MENIKQFQEQENENKLQKFEDPIKELLAYYFDKLRANKKVEFDNLDVQFDGSYSEDMKALQSGNFEISNLRFTPDKGGAESAFHFYVGRTEIHLTNRAAKKIYELMGE